MASKRIFIAGHDGMVGSALVRRLQYEADCEPITRGRSQLDLLDQEAVTRFFNEECIDQVYLAAAKVGGIYANNTYPAEFIYQNLTIQNNVIHSAYKADVERLLFLGSSCIYPKFVEQPIKEEALLSGPLEPTNEPYAIAKIAGIKMCESYNRQYGTDFRSVMPTNLFGPNDNFHPQNSHVIPALMRRFHEAKIQGVDKVIVWGTGKARREFLYVEDLADACVHIMGVEQPAYQAHVQPRCSHINVGTGKDCTIRELAEIMAEVVGFKGAIVFDDGKPDGTPRKLLNIDRLRQIGWQVRTELNQGLVQTYHWLLEQPKSLV